MVNRKSPESVSQQLRQIIENSGLSRYEICRRTGIDQGQLSKFMAGEMWFSEQKFNELGAFLRIRLETEPTEPEMRKPRARKGRKNG